MDDDDTTMAEKYVQVQARHEEKVRIKHLTIEPSLQGATVQFPFVGVAHPSPELPITSSTTDLPMTNGPASGRLPVRSAES
jgi:hypothetical protein